MADLFDVKAPGVGFHLTSHMIAIAALFVACFAITGYITFRDNSIGSEKLKAGADDYTIVTTAVPLPLRTAGTAGTVDYSIVQPANTAIVAYNMYVTDAFTVGAAQVDLRMGTTVGGAEVTTNAAPVQVPAVTYAVNTGLAATLPFNTGAGAVNPIYTPSQRTLTFRVTYSAAATVTEGGSFDLVTTFVHV